MAANKSVANIGDRLRKFIVGPNDDELIERVKDYTHYAAYSSDIWGDSGNLQTMGLMREVPAMTRDPVIGSALDVLMETAFQMNDKQEVMWVVSEYEGIKKMLDRFHEDVNIQKAILTMGYNLLLWGNLPYKHFFDSEGRFVNFTPIPDFTLVTPIIISGKTLGFIVGGEFFYPYEYSYGQLEYYRNLGGIYKNSFVQLSGMVGMGEGIENFQNEFIIAPSYLSKAARPWKNINIIEDALLLNRMDQSNYYRIFSIAVGGSAYSKSAIRTLNYYRNLFKKVRRVSYDSSGMSSRSVGQEFEVIIPKTDKQQVDVTNVGGEIELRAIKDLDVQYNKLFASLKVQPSQIGFGEENTNAIGETNGESYDRRFAKTCKMLVYSVQQVIKNFDYLYLRSRGYDVKMEDWKYGTVSLSVLEDQERGETLSKAVENLKTIGDVFQSIGLEQYNKNYLVESILGGPLSATGIDVQEILKVPEGQDEQGQGQDDQGMPMEMVSGIGYKKAYLLNMLDTMQNTDLASVEFIAAAKASLESGEDRKMITSGTVSQPVVSLSAWDDGMVYGLSEDTPVDVAGQVFFMNGTSDQIAEDMALVSSGGKPQNMVTMDFGQTLMIPQDMQFTLKDFNNAGIRALGRGYINSRNELILVDKADVVSYLHMKKSGQFSCLVSRLYQVP